MAGMVDDIIRQPWRAMKDLHFGGAGESLHASKLRDASQEQMNAIGEFFRTQPFGRFAVTMTAKTQLPANYHPYLIMPNALRARWEELAARCRPHPSEIALIHEASDRGDELVERYFGPTTFKIDGKTLPVHHAFMPKSADEALEVADFVIHAAGRLARAKAFQGPVGFGKDFKAVFHSNPLWSSFMSIDGAEVNSPTTIA